VAMSVFSLISGAINTSTQVKGDRRIQRGVAKGRVEEVGEGIRQGNCWKWGEGGDTRKRKRKRNLDRREIKRREIKRREIKRREIKRREIKRREMGGRKGYDLDM